MSVGAEVRNPKKSGMSSVLFHVSSTTLKSVVSIKRQEELNK